MHKRALGTAETEIPVCAEAQTDFAARMPQHKLVSTTCSHPESSSNDVWVVAHSAFLEKTSDLPEGRRKRRYVKNGVTQRVRQHVSVVFAFSKQKGSAAYHATIQNEIVYVLNNGRAPEGSKLEWFSDGRRLLGSDRSRPLAEGVVDATEAQAFASQPIEHLWIKRDGCSAQFQGKGNFRNTQTYTSRTGVQCKSPFVYPLPSRRYTSDSTHVE